ncbi:MAG TPA: DegT/DnrJ/EryC1/StrS family aminotransferase [Acidimicrobiales bacterium]|nr:DegT/DnrJ/EryC1/StrS family aminotransferase [Acidimicrobiales bacterium]
MLVNARPLEDTDSDDYPVPFCRTEITDEAQLAALRVLKSGWVTTGPETLVFEKEFAAWVGAPEAIAVSSCTAAIQLALMALELPPGAAVLTPTLTFCSAVHAIVHAGLRPVLVDVDEATLTVSAEGVATAARAGAAAMVVQHMAGYPVDPGPLAEAAGLTPNLVIEDAAHGLGAAVGARPVGCLARAACFSFYATKNLPIGEGGAITTADPELAARVARMRLHGMNRDAWRRYGPGGSWRYSVEDSGFKANFTDVQAAIGSAQLSSLDGWQRRRQVIASQYDALLAGVPGVTLPPRPATDRHGWHLYIVRIGPEFAISRDEAVEALAERGIGTSVHFIPVHHQPYFRRLLGREVCDGLPVADRVFPELLSLPFHPGLQDQQIERVGTALADIGSSRPRLRLAAGTANR